MTSIRNPMDDAARIAVEHCRKWSYDLYDGVDRDDLADKIRCAIRKREKEALEYGLSKWYRFTNSEGQHSLHNAWESYLKSRKER